MIIFTCNYCEHPHFVSYAGPRKVERIVCGECAETSFLVHSNISPISYPEKWAVVDEVARTIKFREPET